MKTKLLKKVRKRFCITKIDELASNCGNVYEEIAKRKGLPFYVLSDNNDAFSWESEFYKHIEYAKIGLWRKIMKAYGEKFRHKDEVSSKAWWVSS